MRTLLFSADPEIREAVGRVVHARGHALQVCEDIDAARNAYVRERPPLVILAGVEADSLMLCRQIRSAEAGDPVTILVVVHEENQEMLPAVLHAGADDYMLAPLRQERLEARIAFAEQKAREKLRSGHVEAELNARARQQAVVAELGQRALAGADPQAVMDYAVEATAQALRVPYCKVLRLLPGKATFIMQAAVGWPASFVGTATVHAGEESQAGYTLLSSEPVVMEDLNTESRFRGTDLLREQGIVSGVSVVVAGENAPFGTLIAHTDVRRTFSKDDIHFLQAVANVLAAVIERKRAEDDLRESEAKVRAVLETTVDGIITIDEKGCIESFNPAAEMIFGYRAEEVIGRNVKVLMPSPYREEHDGYMDSYYKTGQRKIIGIGREVVGEHKDGSTFPLDLAVSEVALRGRRIFTGIVRDITERRRLEQEILEISEQERRRIGQDLHDGLGQMLTGIGLIARNLTRRLQGEGVSGADEMAEITELIKEADQYARGLARSLVPVELDASGLAASLQRLAFNAERLFGIRCVFDEVGTALLYDNTAATHLYRIAQEAVSNAVKHGRATQVTVTLASGEEQVRLRVQDDGIGFPEVLPEQRGMGVRIMHHRARMIGASLEIRSASEGGAVLTCTLPLSGSVYALKKTGKPKTRETTL